MHFKIYRIFRYLEMCHFAFGKIIPSQVVCLCVTEYVYV